MSKLTVGTENTNDIDLHFDDHGSGDPVVLIHGWPLSGRSWEAQVPALVEAGHRVVTYDRRGFGWSSQPWEGYDYDTFTSDLHALIEHLDLRDIAEFASPKGTHDCIEAFSYTDFRGDRERFDPPTLVIHGDSDAIVPFEVSGKRTHESISGSELALIEGGPHALNATHPEEFNRALLEFLGR